MNSLIARNSGDAHIISIKKKKDWYYDYFKNAKKVFRLKQNAVDLAMDKVDKIINAKMKKMALSGKREAYAAMIMYLVATELNLPIKMKDISKVSNNPTPQALTNAHKRLKSVFKEWFRSYKMPQHIMPKKCELLGYPQKLTEDA
jgi:hypothetical protein